MTLYSGFLLDLGLLPIMQSRLNNKDTVYYLETKGIIIGFSHRLPNNKFLAWTLELQLYHYKLSYANESAKHSIENWMVKNMWVLKRLPTIKEVFSKRKRTNPSRWDISQLYLGFGFLFYSSRIPSNDTTSTIKPINVNEKYVGGIVDLGFASVETQRQILHGKIIWRNILANGFFESFARNISTSSWETGLVSVVTLVLGRRINISVHYSVMSTLISATPGHIENQQIGLTATISSIVKHQIGLTVGYVL